MRSIDEKEGAKALVRHVKVCDGLCAKGCVERTLSFNRTLLHFGQQVRHFELTDDAMLTQQAHLCRRQTDSEGAVFYLLGPADSTDSASTATATDLHTIGLVKVKTNSSVLCLCSIPNGCLILDSLSTKPNPNLSCG